MKTTTTVSSQHCGLRRVSVALALFGLFTLTTVPSYAGHHANAKTTRLAKAAPEPPNVTLPYSFMCPHCGMKITIKTPADWNKSCQTCACGKTNLGCYNDVKKK